MRGSARYLRDERTPRMREGQLLGDGTNPACECGHAVTEHEASPYMPCTVCDCEGFEPEWGP